MIEITGYFPDSTVIRRVFNCVLDAIEYKDNLDAQYIKVDWNNKIQTEEEFAGWGS